MFNRKAVSYLVMAITVVLLGGIIMTNFPERSTINRANQQIVQLATPLVELSPQTTISPETAVPSPTWPPDLPTGVAPTDVANQAPYTPWPTFPPPPRLDVTPMVTVDESPLEARSDLLPISEVINRAEGLPEQEIYVAIIRRSDGIYAKILLPLSILNYGNFQDNLSKELNLNAQEKLINAFPLVPRTPLGGPTVVPTAIAETD